MFLSVLLVLVVARIYTTTSQVTSSENFNEIMDKLIQQVNDSNVNRDGHEEWVTERNAVSIDADDPPGTRQERNGANDEEEEEEDSSQDTSNDKNTNTLRINDKYNTKLSLTKQSPYGRIPQKPINLLHEYPELVIDHINYNINNATQSNAKKDFPIEVKRGMSNFGNSMYKKLLPQSNPSVPLKSAGEHSELNIHPSLQKVIDSITRNKMHGGTLKEITERESRTQNILLKNIIERLLHEKLQEDPQRIESRGLYPNHIGYPLPNENNGLGLLPLLHNSQHNLISTTYLRTPTTPHLSHDRLRLSRYLAMQRLSSPLVRRSMYRYSHQHNLPLYSVL